MKVVYCSNCGKELTIVRKAMPKFAKILDIVDPHVCTEEVQMPELIPQSTPIPMSPDDRKFVRKLNELNKPSISTEDFRDRREETSRSSAPRNLLDQMKPPED